MRHLPAVLLIAALSAFAAAAQAGPRLEMRGQVYAEVQTVNSKHETVRELRPAGNRIMPGDTLVYVITYRNVGDTASDKVSINVPIPPEVSYVAGWVEGSDAKPEVSTDYGEEYRPYEKLSVTNADGSIRAPLPSEVTNLRWDMDLVVQPGAEGKLLYRTRFKTPRYYDVSRPHFDK
jgi:uncharacterized repeat protein (TIGR01451 family)